MARLSEPGESLSTFIGRAVNALDILARQKGTRAEPSDVSTRSVQEKDLESLIAEEVARYVSSDIFRDHVFGPILRQALSSYLSSEPGSQLSRELSGEVSSDASRPHAPMQKADVLNRLRALKAQGLSLQAMAIRLNAEGVPTLSGRGRWQKGTVGNLLAQGED